ncbi:glycosyl transferase [Meredithblackwellia eburnea MCA 4105]
MTPSSPGCILRVPPARFILLVLVIVVLAVSHLVLNSTSNEYNKHFKDKISQTLASLALTNNKNQPSTWFNGHKRPLAWSPPPPQGLNNDDDTPTLAKEHRRANATFVILARNSDIWDLLASIRGMQDRFNSKYNYPYVFLNEEPFSEEFKIHTSAIAAGSTCSYGLIPRQEFLDVPAWIDMDRANAGMAEMSKKPIPYGWSLPYRKMCRYQSGFFWKHPLLYGYKYYWRIEPNVKYFCDIDYDPFLLMQERNKSYGFVVTLKEYADTIPTLWAETKKFIEAHPQYLANKNLYDWLTSDGGETYNLCHFWSNWEIGNLDFWRGEAYAKYFEWLDRAGGFFYERWGDAPVHSIAAALFLTQDEFHFFQDIGYRHEPFQHCPQDKADVCACNPADTFETHWYSCTPSFKTITGWKPE